MLLWTLVLVHFYVLVSIYVSCTRGCVQLLMLSRYLRLSFVGCLCSHISDMNQAALYNASKTSKYCLVEEIKLVTSVHNIW